MQNYSFKVEENLSDKRLDSYIASLTPYSRSRIQHLIRNSYVQVNNLTVNITKFHVHTNDEVSINIPIRKTEEVLPQSIEINIIYEDSNLLVINKQAGLSTHPGNNNYNNSLVNGLISYLGDNLSSLAGSERPGIVHRLDKDTTGLMVVAKNDKTHENLAQQIKDRTLQRRYYALVWGIFIPDFGTINKNIMRSTINYTRMSISKIDGKEAITHYKTISVFKKANISLVECKLETGRTHQIRVHLSHASHSIVGDQVYGHNARKLSKIKDIQIKELISTLHRQALHSHTISFIHPMTNDIMSFSSELPDDMKKMIKILQ